MGYDFVVEGDIYFTSTAENIKLYKQNLKKQFERENDNDIEIYYDKDTKTAKINMHMDWHWGGGFFEYCSDYVIAFLKNNNIVNASGIISETNIDTSEFTSIHIIKESSIIHKYKASDIIKLLKEKHNI